MKLAIMQPYFFPYIGYFQLISAVDTFIVYDNIKYTKKGWINRNRILKNGKDATISLPLKRASDALDICEREISEDFKRGKLVNQIKGAYQSAPYYKQCIPLVEEIIQHEGHNLFRFLYHSIVTTCNYLGINTEIVISSSVDIDHSLKSQNRVLALCKACQAHTYINPIGGTELYSKKDFLRNGIELNFIKSKPLEYLQFSGEFVPWLSIIDVLMFNSLQDIQNNLGKYELI